MCWLGGCVVSRELENGSRAKPPSAIPFLKMLTAIQIRRKWFVQVWLLLGGLGGLLALPESTQQGVNYQVTAHRISLGAKSAQFILRDAEYRRLAREISEGYPAGEPRALALMRWVKGHLRPTPKGWPVVDDHILNIIIRGYGAPDQMADVFTTLSTYAGHPAFWRTVKLRNGMGEVTLSFVRIDGRWTVWGVDLDKPFRNESGALADVSELIQNPRLVTLTAGETTYRGRPYWQYIDEGLAPFQVPQMLRAEKQMPGRRIPFEMGRVWQSLQASLIRMFRNVIRGGESV